MPHAGSLPPHPRVAWATSASDGPLAAPVKIFDTLIRSPADASALREEYAAVPADRAEQRRRQP